MGDESWFELHQRDISLFCGDTRLGELMNLLEMYGFKLLSPYLCRYNHEGALARGGGAQPKRFLDHFESLEVVPRIGGVLGDYCLVKSAWWRAKLVASAVDFLEKYPRLAGVKVFIGTLPCGHCVFLILLFELKLATSAWKMLIHGQLGVILFQKFIDKNLTVSNSLVESIGSC